MLLKALKNLLPAAKKNAPLSAPIQPAPLTASIIENDRGAFYVTIQSGDNVKSQTKIDASWSPLWMGIYRDYLLYEASLKYRIEIGHIEFPPILSMETTHVSDTCEGYTLTQFLLIGESDEPVVSQLVNAPESTILAAFIALYLENKK